MGSEEESSFRFCGAWRDLDFLLLSIIVRKDFFDSRNGCDVAKAIVVLQRCDCHNGVCAMYTSACFEGIPWKF